VRFIQVCNVRFPTATEAFARCNVTACNGDDVVALEVGGGDTQGISRTLLFLCRKHAGEISKQIQEHLE
jgi:hypothetical protein